RHLRRRSGTPARRPRRQRHRRGHRPREPAAEIGARAAQLPQPRRVAGIRRVQHHDGSAGAGDLPPGARAHPGRRPRRRGRDGARVAEGDLARVAPRLGELRDRASGWMTPPLHLVVPGPLDQRTGGYIYDRRVVDGLRALGWTIQVHELAGGFPWADEVACAAAADAIAAMPPGALPVIDGLALPAFADLGARLPQPWVALIHH